MFVGLATTATSLYSTGTQYVGYAKQADSINPLNTGTQYVGYATRATTATNIDGGATGDLLYQSAPNTTAKLTASATAGALLASGGAATAPLYVAQVKASNGSASATQATGQSLVVTGGGLGVTGDSYFSANVGVGGNLQITSNTANTQTAASNSLYVQGGAWISQSLVVTGDTAFRGNVVFNGTVTNVISTNTYYTDNILELHTPPSGPSGAWTTNDGKDIGLRFHWYDTADHNAALVMDNTTRALAWYQSGAEQPWGQTSDGKITGGVYGTFKTGNIVLATGNATNNSSSSGDLQATGGAYIGKDLYVGTTATINGSLVLTNALTVPNGGTGLTSVASGALLYGNNAGALNSLSISGTSGQILSSDGTVPKWTSISGLTAGNATTATHLALGTAGQMPYQTAPGRTDFFGPGNSGQILVSSGGTGGIPPVYTNTGSIFVGLATTATSLANTATQYVAYAARADSINSANTSSVFVGLATTATSLANTGTQYVGYAKQADSINSANTSSVFVGTAAQANNMNGGLAGQINYQSSAGVTSFISTGTAGTILQMGANIPAFATTSSIFVGLATTATSLYNTSSQYVAYAARADSINPANTTSQYVGYAGTATQLSNTSSQYIGYANTSMHVIGGLKDQIPYQSAPGQTKFDAGLTYNGTTFTSTNHVVSGTTDSVAYGASTGSLVTVGGAAIAKNLYVGADLNVNGNINVVGTGTILFAGLGADKINSTTGTFVNILATGTSATYSTQTGALQVSGGVGIGGGLFVGGIVTATTFVGSFNGTVTTATNMGGGAAGSIPFQVAPDKTSFIGIPASSPGLILQVGASNTASFVSTSSIFVGLATTATSLYNTGTQYVGYANKSNNLFGASGGIPYQTALDTTGYDASNFKYSGSILTVPAVSITQTTPANGPNTGALQVTGGASIGGNLVVGGNSYIAGDLYVDGTQFVVNTQAIQTGDKALVLSTGSTTALQSTGAGLFIGVTSSTAYSSFTYDGISAWVTGGSSGGGLKVSATTSTYSTSSGALQVVGGVGIGGGLYVGGTVTATTFVGSFNGTVTTATNMGGGAAGSIPFQVAPDKTSFIGIGAGATGQILQVGASNTASFVTTSSIFVGFSVTATNLFSGSAGQIPYQTAPGATTFLSAASSQGQFLRYGPSNAPIWSSTGTFSGGVASTSSQVSQSVTVSSGGVAVVGDSYINGQLAVGSTLFANSIIASGTIIGGGVRSTTSANPPASPTVGDIWYATGTDDIYRYTTDGSTSFWLDISGPSVANSAVGLVSLATLKAVTAASTSFADFQTRIAAL